KVIRPFVRSYGVISTFTRSPARTRMRFLRILPEVCASTSWLLSSFTRNIALGSSSVTVPENSIRSSLAIYPPLAVVGRGRRGGRHPAPPPFRNLRFGADHSAIRHPEQTPRAIDRCPLPGPKGTRAAARSSQ